MNRRFNTENFEKSLKEHADDFKMTPSKKVWHGIYNDLHPGTRWPSIAMSLIFIFTLVIIGHLNTNNSKLLATLDPPDKQISSDNTKTKKKIKTHLSRSNYNSTNTTETKSTNNNIANNSTQPTDQTDKNISPVFALANNTTSLNNNIGFNEHGSNTKLNVTDPADVTNESVLNNQFYSSIKKNNKTTQNNNIVTGELNTITNNENGDIKSTNKKTDGTAENAKNNVALNNISNLINDNKDNKNEITPGKKMADEKQELKNKAKETVAKQEEKKSGSSFLNKKIRDKISINYYITPSVGYRSLYERNIHSNPTAGTSASSGIPTQQNINSLVKNKPSIGVEFGGALSYKLSKRWQVTAGLQLNYTGYNIIANSVHPVSTSVLLISDFTGEPYAFNSMSTYGNGSNSSQVKLHQYTFQASAPFGFKYLIAKNNNLEFNIESTLQPSYVISTKAYLLSADKRNYVSESSLLRRLNLSTNIGTYVSFKSEKYNWEIGPQVFYQLFSTYISNDPIHDHFINYGIRVGVNKLKK